ncbi:DUF1801 domain-containing protein [Thermomonas sp. HDW16]|uniref:DUF1801 domain-containing protein n=1 Tax=Thermomonas sp. HDW16 TaxID=2714945 RepID=UPI0014078CF3|nr:DUF1801 domain-containing protein [Thermomonas sp. HDW16]QIL20225.1 DUF1801 domain-containing protein [Thermomonas sp. HDW16]
MSESKTRPTTVSVSEFLAQQTDERRVDCEAVVQMMEASTGERAEMWGAAIVGFGRYAYTNSTKKPQEWPLVGFSPRKNDLTLYIMPGFDGFTELMAQLGKHKTGKSCLYLKKLADVDAKVLHKLIDGSVKAMEPQRIRR